MQVEQKQWTKAAGWQVLSEKELRERANLVFVFGERMLFNDKKHLGEVKKFYPKAAIIGATTSGEILGTRVQDETLAVTAVSFDSTRIKVAKEQVKTMEDSFDAGKRLAEQLNKEGLVNVFVLSDGLNVNGSGLAGGLNSVLSKAVVVTGGLAGDQARFEKTFILTNDEAATSTVVAIGFYSDSLKVGYGSMGGWDSFGLDRLVTKSEGNVLYELDNEPALELYKKYLGDQASGLPATGMLFPLSLRLQDGESGLVRTILAVDEEKNSMTFAGDIPQGSYARLMKANFERLVEGASGAANVATQTLRDSSPDLAILISCVGRKLVLKQRTEEEVENVQHVLGETTALIGFYSYGEICPVGTTEKQCELHNQTMTITTFKE